MPRSLLTLSWVPRSPRMSSHDSIIVALAWPDTRVVREGKWYDVPMKWVGAIRDNHYKAGHAAFLLINKSTGDVHYFDFGRYHTPIKHGRVRDKTTDPDIAIEQKAVIEGSSILNLDELLEACYKNEACHGNGRLVASVVQNIDFNKAFTKVKQMQQREAILYGPFEPKGTTCSRLVVQIVLVSTNDRLTKFLIRLPYTVSATPRSNTKIINDYPFYFEIDNGKLYKRTNRFLAVKYALKSLYRKQQDIESVFSVGFLTKTIKPL